MIDRGGGVARPAAEAAELRVFSRQVGLPALFPPALPPPVGPGPASAATPSG